ncbi:MAG: polysaccharide deacetylase family protein, partial [Endomicrobiia bacterium]
LKNILDIFYVGSHTLSHLDLTQVSEQELIFELNESKKILEKEINTEIKHFCYPFGKVPKKYKEVLQRTNYQTATTLKNGLIYKNNKNLDFYLLPRIEWKEISNMSFKDFIKNLDFYLKILFAV